LVQKEQGWGGERSPLKGNKKKGRRTSTHGKVYSVCPARRERLEPLLGREVGITNDGERAEMRFNLGRGNPEKVVGKKSRIPKFIGPTKSRNERENTKQGREGGKERKGKRREKAASQGRNGTFWLGGKVGGG